MGHFSCATAALCMLLVVPHTTKAGNITYVIQSYSNDQSGWIISGTIETDGKTNVPLTKADIVSWTREDRKRGDKSSGARSDFNPTTVPALQLDGRHDRDWPG